MDCLRLAARFWPSNLADAHAAAGAGRGHGGNGRVGGGGTEGPEGAIFAYMSVNHLGYCLLGISRWRFGGGRGGADESGPWR